MARKVSNKDIKAAASRVLWGRAAGRCQFNQCNKPLWKSPVTQEDANIAERAHIWSASDDGPRGNEGIPDESLNSIDNLLLLCHDCHVLIDKDKDGGRYDAKTLIKWKLDHELRVELATAMTESHKSQIVTYGAPIADHSSPLTYAATNGVLFPDHYPASPRAIELAMTGAWRDRDAEFWKIESEHLRKRIELELRPLVASGEVSHLSVFALAPQPLLILFGSLLTDIVPVQVRQLRREPQGWAWPSNTAPTMFHLQAPENTNGRPALVFSMSATITHDRIERVLGDDCSIWSITPASIGRDCISCPDDLSRFRQIARQALDSIKAAHGQTTAISVFPAMPVSAAVEFGRIRMPKADTNWVIYDQNNEQGGFIEALRLGLTGVER